MPHLPPPADTAAMARTKDHVTGSAGPQGQLRRAHDVTVFEQRMVALYESALNDLLIHDGTTLLDIGCRDGLFLRLAAQRGATVAGVDVVADLVELARERLPDADLTVSDTESLPYDDDTFAIVTGFNSFQFAADPVLALDEARRVARPHAPVIIATWGRLDQCEAAAYVNALLGMLPQPPSGAQWPFALSEDGAIEAFASSGGLTPLERRDVFCVWSFPDDLTTLRALTSTPFAVTAGAHAGEEEIAAAILEAIAPYRLSGGGYRLENTFTYLMAQA